MSTTGYVVEICMPAYVFCAFVPVNLYHECTWVYSAQHAFMHACMHVYTCVRAHVWVCIQSPRMYIHLHARRCVHVCMYMDMG